MKRHLVTFYSPGTLFSETTTKKIDSWDINKAKEMVYDIQERHGATPYGFCFSTEEIKKGQWQPSEVKRSNMYFLGGKIETLSEIKAKNNREDRKLIFNMEANGYNKVITNCNSWKITLPFDEKDIVLDFKPIKKEM